MSHRNVYIISGPCGVGKSTVAKELAGRLENAVLITGDHLLHMFVGYDFSWEVRLYITWENILALTRTFLRTGCNLVIDFVVEDELNWFIEELDGYAALAQYVVLTADEGVLRERVTQRGDLDIMDRSLFLREKLTGSPRNQAFLLDTTHQTPTDIVDAILASKRFTVQ